MQRNVIKKKSVVAQKNTKKTDIQEWSKLFKHSWQTAEFGGLSRSLTEKSELPKTG